MESFKYLEKRFGKLTRMLCSLAFVVQMILYTSVVLYAPMLALSAVSNLSIWYSVISVGVVCTFYCTLGGMKAVLWTDVFQAILMYLCLLTIVIKGCLDVGGIAAVFRIASENGRLPTPSFSIDPTVRYTMWNIIGNGVIGSMAVYGGNQVQIQRLLTVKDLSHSRKALFLNIPMRVGFHLLNCLAGIVIYANFYQCDPNTSPGKPISSVDQLLPYYVMKALGHLPGLPGLCISGIFSASLSTVSSAVNSLAAVTMQDFVCPFCSLCGLSNRKSVFFAKAITLFYGLLCVLLTFLVANFGNVIQATLIIYGILVGPVFSVFFLGMLTTRTNQKGVVIGLVTSVTLTAWLGFGSSVWGPHPVTLPVSVSGCEVTGNATVSQLIMVTSFENDTATLRDFNVTETLVNKDFERYVFPLYRIAYLWYIVIGFGTGVVVSYIASIVAEKITGDSEPIPMEYLSPVLRRFIKYPAENALKPSLQVVEDVHLSG